MNELTIRIDGTDNDAFRPYAHPEVARLLHRLADRIDDQGLASGDGGNLTDLNGNTVGTWTWDEPK